MTQFLIALAIIVVLVAIYYQYTYEQRVAERLEGLYARGRAALVGAVPEVITRRRREDLDAISAELPQKFGAWVANLPSANAKQLTERLALLPQPHFTLLTEQIADFCSDLNFELSWLIDGKVQRDPKLQQELTAVVVDHALVQWRAMALQADLYTFMTVELWLQESTVTTHREMARQLFTLLSEHDLVEISPNMFLATDAERIDYTIKLVRDVATTKREAFQEVVREMLAINDTAATIA